MKKLLKQYGFNSDMQYFEMIIESFINGQRSQAIRQFKAMPKKERQDMIKAVIANWITGIEGRDINLLIDAI
jgi:hypothetical protein